MIEILFNWLSFFWDIFSYIGKIIKIISPRNYYRISFKRKMKPIIEDFQDCLDSMKSCSLILMINKIDKKEIPEKTRIELEWQSKISALLEKRLEFFKRSINHLDIGYLPEILDEFAYILNETHDIFRSFYTSIENQSDIVKMLKADDSGYPTFKKIYDKTTNSFENLCNEASVKLKKEIRTHKFTGLPEF